MSKVTIAEAVLAGLGVSERLNELTIVDDELFEQVGRLAQALANIMFVAEKIELATQLVIEANVQGNIERVAEGLNAIKGVTQDLISDQDKIDEAMGLTEEEILLFQILSQLKS